MNNKIVISGFDYTGNFVKPWAEAGYLCICVDIQHPKYERVGNIIKINTNMMDFEPPNGDIVFSAFFTPCTHVAVSGARWFREKGLGKLIESLQLFERSRLLGQKIGAPYLIENPVSVFASYAGKPDYTFDPCDYGDPYTKKTCLWTGGGFVMPPKNRIEPTEGSKMHLLPPSQERANLRSATPMGFSRAVFEANRPDRIWSAA